MNNQITYANKVALNQNSSIPDINKVNADDMNEIKAKHNGVMDGSLPMGNVVVDSIRSKNMFNVNSCVGGNLDNGAVVGSDKVNIISTNTETGTIIYTSTEAWRGIVSDYIEVNEGEQYILNYTRSTNAILSFIAYFNSNKQQVGGTTEISYQTAMTIPSSIKYVRFILEPSSLIAGNITLSNIQFEKGSSATTFTPYENLDTQIIPITPTFTSSVSSNDLDYECVRIGKYVFLKLNTIVFNTSGSTHDETFITGLPKAEKVHIFLLNTGWSNMANDSLGRFKILTDGTIKSHYALLNSGNEVMGGILIYRTTD